MIFSFLKKYSHVNWALADQAMVSGVNFLTGILFARYLGLDEYGRFTLAWMAVLFCNSFQQAGIIAPMMSIGPKQTPEEEPGYYGAVFVQQVIWSVVCSLLLWLGVRLSTVLYPQWQVANLAGPLAVTLFAWQLQDFLRRYFFVRNQGGMAFLNDAISYLGQVTLLIVLFRCTTADTARVLWLIAGTSSLALLAGLFKLGRFSLSKTTLCAVSRKHWIFSRWLLASALMQWFSGNFYFVVAGAILGPVIVGGIKAAQNIIGVTHILFQSMENFAPSGAARSFVQGGAAALTAYLRRLTFLGAFVTGSVALVAWCFPESLLDLLYGATFTQYGVILRWFCIIYLCVFLTTPLAVGLRAIEKTRPLFVAQSVAGLLSLATAYPLIEKFAATGVMAGLLLVRISIVIFLFISLYIKVLKNIQF